MELEQSKIASQQFAEDYLLVMMNDQDAYNEIMSQSKELETYELAEWLRDEYEEVMDQVSQTAEDKISEISSLLVRQLLLGWGIEPFIIIARDIKEMN
jgi:gas vesicle protein